MPGMVALLTCDGAALGKNPEFLAAHLAEVGERINGGVSFGAAHHGLDLSGNDRGPCVLGDDACDDALCSRDHSVGRTQADAAVEGIEGNESFDSVGADRQGCPFQS